MTQKCYDRACSIAVFWLFYARPFSPLSGFTRPTNHMNQMRKIGIVRVRHDLAFGSDELRGHPLQHCNGK